MNRRELFKFAPAAAVALPAIVNAAASPAYATGGVIRGVKGFRWAWIDQDQSLWFPARHWRFVFQGQVSVPDPDDPADPIIEQQMIEHDLFEGIGT